MPPTTPLAATRAAAKPRTGREVVAWATAVGIHVPERVRRQVCERRISYRLTPAEAKVRAREREWQRAQR